MMFQNKENIKKIKKQLKKDFGTLKDLEQKAKDTYKETERKSKRFNSLAQKQRNKLPLSELPDMNSHN